MTRLDSYYLVDIKTKLINIIEEKAKSKTQRKYIQKHITITDLPEALCGILTGYREWKAAALKW